MKFPKPDHWLQSRMPPYHAFEDFLEYQLYKITGRFHAQLSAVLAEFHLVPPQYSILLGLRETEGHRNQLTLALQLGIDKALMVRMLDGLEKQGYAKRLASADDRREKLVTITDEGRQVVEVVTTKNLELERAFLSGLDIQEQQSLRAIIKKLNYT